jgi:hypothetical protein
MSTWFPALSLAHRIHPQHRNHHHEHIDSDFETDESDHTGMARIRRKKSTASHHAKNLALCAISALMVLLLGLYYISGKAVSFEITKQLPKSNLRIRNQWISSEEQAFVSQSTLLTDAASAGAILHPANVKANEDFVAQNIHLIEP